jgi:MFS transporter, DHA1 family, inner membrane transport protein
LLLGRNVGAAAVVIAGWGLLIDLLPPVFQLRLLRIASPGRGATASAIGITVLNLGIAAGAALGGAVLDHLPVAALPGVAAAVIAVAALGLAGSAAHDGYRERMQKRIRPGNGLSSSVRG